MRCKWQGANTHQTRDEVSPGAVKTLAVATFPAGYSAACECKLSQGKVSAEDCSSISVFDESGTPVAHFKAKKYRMGQNESGEIVIYAMPSGQTQDSNTRCGDMRAHGLAAHGERLAGINQRNADFWAARDAEN